ncbi:pilus assembly protein TadG-related protein [Brevibacterium casei]|uniref:Flp pilus-assembly TadE/G-like n=2 Tax=Brevibacterium casei TaxID=33889 RepID=A0A2H1K602_9MICO|nr:pilus assembly protein TadG-related protein [Brevibacterium casei]SIG51141.1 Predicted membrane protein [Mycobacteroides abscessus subsp. abscessus]EKU48633.1 hypothetical protein C272_03710 [Brevibacterium casei S18]MBE4693297.1 hypothetical protein [Brevibacterium casei]MBY3576420.1 hypothetical protein [Brevibacterium casei]MCT1446710.1 pilus assembly protein TadG-related protein [Brevibacterium casei]
MESARTADAVSVDRHGSDRGSITPLAIGFVVIALLLAFLIAALTDLHMARRELQAVADSAALAASDSFEPAPGDDPGLVFSPDAAERAAVRYVASVDTPDDLRNIGVDADVDGEHSVVIRLRADYIPAVLSPFVPRFIDLSATAYARGSLRIS